MTTRTLLRSSFVAASLAASAAVACGETSGSVLERIPESGSQDSGLPTPPDSNLDVDVVIVRNIESCAVGEPCRDDPDMWGDDVCFDFVFDDGSRTSFQASSLDFVAPNDERCTEQSQRFDLRIDEQTEARTIQAFEELKTRIYQLSNQEILLDLHFHVLPSLASGFISIDNEWRFYLPTSALVSSTSSLSRETDFTFAVTGFRDDERNLEPRIERCAGTIGDLGQSFAGAGYTWLTTGCNNYHTLVRHWMFQVGVARRDANGFSNVYDYYPHCGQADADPKRWFPDPNDCSVDPDAPTCDDNHCEGSDDEFVAHVLQAHWPGPSFVGNRCDNGQEDFDETGVDQGGVCDELGR
ncbi:MAG TPA: hypothetical protein VFZ53_29255 [Polyangiaceae bacterium]